VGWQSRSLAQLAVVVADRFHDPNQHLKPDLFSRAEVGRAKLDNNDNGVLTTSVACATTGDGQKFCSIRFGRTA
jgi:hypothetical protein